MSPLMVCTLYLVLIAGATVLGGLLPRMLELTHRRLEAGLSFTAGIMLGTAVLHMLPSAFESSSDHHQLGLFILAGLLLMFFLERIFCFHHHDAPGATSTCSHNHELRWGGALIGLTVHSLLEGVALGAAFSVESELRQVAYPGVGVLLAILLHKPFESLTVTSLMTARGMGFGAQALVIALFCVVVPVGWLLFYLGIGVSGDSLALVVAFSVGVFLCISLSDLLPELQFHQHDRVLLSVSMLGGVAISWLVLLLEELTHAH